MSGHPENGGERDDLVDGETVLSDRELGIGDAPQSHRSRSRAVVVALIEIAILIGLFWILFSRIDAGDVIGRLGLLSIIGGVAVGATYILHAVVSAIRWRIFVRHFGGDCSFGAVLRGTLLERMVNQAIPSPVAGDGARFVEMRRSDISARTAALSVILDRLFGLGGVISLVTLLSPFTLVNVESPGTKIAIIVLALIPVIGLGALVGVRTTTWRRLQQVRFLHYPAGLAIVIRTVVRTPKLFAKGVALSIAAQSIPTLAFIVLSYDLKIALPVLDAILLVPLIILASVVPISIAGWGVRESAAAVLLVGAGISSADAVLLSVLYGLIGLLTAAAGALVWFATRHIGHRSKA